MRNARTGPLTESGPALTTNRLASILPRVNRRGKDKHRAAGKTTGYVRIPAPRPGQPFSQVRALITEPVDLAAGRGSEAKAT
jgi:hypothetical protein